MTNNHQTLTNKVIEGSGATTASNITDLVFILDRSGSMYGLESDTIGGFNSVLEKNKAQDGTCFVSTVLFDDGAQVLHDRLDIQSVAPMTAKEYTLGGCTALLDAVGNAIRHHDMIQRYLPKGHKSTQVIFVIITDGMENASSKYTYGQVKEMIKGHESSGWEFMFLGANIDAAAEAGRMGIKLENAANYVHDSIGTQAVYEDVCEAVSHRRAWGAMPTKAFSRTRADHKKRG